MFGATIQINKTTGVDLKQIPTEELFEELVIRAFIIAPPMGTNIPGSIGGEDLRARVQSMLMSVNDFRFAKRDPFELEEVMKKTSTILVNNMTDLELKNTIDKVGNSLVSYLDAQKQPAGGIFSRQVYPKEIMDMINAFMDFIKRNNIPEVSSYDRFKPIYEKFIAVTPNADKIIGEDTVGFFNKLQQAGLK